MTSLAHEPKNDAAPTLSVLQFYEQASQNCRHYSQLTMSLRALTQQVMLGSAVGIGVFFANAPGEQLQVGLVCAGVLLLLVAGALDRLNLHYSHAFVEIRDRCLVPLESAILPLRREGGGAAAGAPIGPWTAHSVARGRNEWLRRLGWHGPYIVLAIVGAGCIALGVLWHPGAH